LFSIFCPETGSSQDDNDVCALHFYPKIRVGHVTIPPQRGGSKVHFTEEQLTVMRGGLTVEEYRQKTMAPCPHSASCLTNIASLCPKLSNP
jgi:hypothetical protein